MTVIVGIAQQGTVWIGGDSAGSDGWTTRASALHKVFHRGHFLIGYTGSFRMGQLLQYSLKVRVQRSGLTDEAYMASVFVDAVRACFRDGGYSRSESGREEGGTFLAAYHGNLYHIQDDYQVQRSLSGYDAAGSGYMIALGAMAAMATVEPAQRIARALEITAEFASDVCAPFLIEQQAYRPNPAVNETAAS